MKLTIDDLFPIITDIVPVNNSIYIYGAIGINRGMSLEYVPIVGIMDLVKMNLTFYKKIEWVENNENVVYSQILVKPYDPAL